LITTNLSKKYKHDLFANELILLAYYIATVNIETTYSNLKGGKYTPFQGISYTDTLRLNAQYRKESRHRQVDKSLDDTFKIAHERIRNQRGSHVHVIMGNPPYSAGQSKFSDNNPNIKYPEIDNRIKETYSKKSTSNLQSSLYDSYVRSFRWASDRMGDSGIIAFITNASFLRTPTTLGSIQSIHKVKKDSKSKFLPSILLISSTCNSTETVKGLPNSYGNVGNLNSSRIL